MKVSFSLKGKAAPKPVGEAPSLKRTAAFAALDDDESQLVSEEIAHLQNVYVEVRYTIVK